MSPNTWHHERSDLQAVPAAAEPPTHCQAPPPTELQTVAVPDRGIGTFGASSLPIR